VKEHPVVLVMGTTGEDPPPGIERIAGSADLRYAPDRATLEARIPAADVVYTWWGDPADLEAAWPLATRLRWVQAVNVGIEKVLFPALVESDVALTNARGAAEGPIAETVLGFLVAMAKDFRRMFDDQREHRWDPHATERLAGTRLLVVGPGPIGRAIARAARGGLGIGVEAVGRVPRPPDGDFERIHGADELLMALAEADHVVNAMPLTPETRGLFAAAGLATFEWTTFEFPPPQARTTAWLESKGVRGQRVVDTIEAIATRVPGVRRLGSHPHRSAASGGCPCRVST
jgi:phosphoglycerate dehydrogenase-like enzyme